MHAKRGFGKSTAPLLPGRGYPPVNARVEENEEAFWEEMRRRAETPFDFFQASRLALLHKAKPL